MPIAKTKSAAPAPTPARHRIFGMQFARSHPAWLAKELRKGRAQQELDKLIDELAQGRAMEKILRQ